MSTSLAYPLRESRPFTRLLVRASDGVARLERLACGGLIIAFASLVLANVVMRYAFSQPLIFAEELAVLMMTWMAFLASSLALYRRELVAVTMLADALPEGWRTALRWLNAVLTVAILAVILVTGLMWLSSRATGYELAVTLGVARWPFFTIVPFTAATMLLHTLAQLVRGAEPVMPTTHGETLPC